MRFQVPCVAIRAMARSTMHVMFPQVARIWSLSVGEVCPCWHEGLGKLRQKHLANRNKCPATMILRSQYKKCTLHSDFKNVYSTSLNLCGSPLFDKCNPQVHALERKSSWYTFKSGLSTSNLSEMIHWRPGFLHGRLHWSLTSLPSRQPKPIDLALGVRKQSWIGGLMRRIKTFQNILTSFCCIWIIIRQFLHISTPLVTSAKALSVTASHFTVLPFPFMRNVFVEAGCHNNWAATAGSSWSRAMNQEPPAPTASTTVKSAAQIPVHSRKPHRAVYNLQPEHALMITKVFKCFQIHAIWCNIIGSFKDTMSQCAVNRQSSTIHLATFRNQSLVHLLCLRKLCTERSAQAPIWPWVWPQYQLISTTQEST